MKRLPPNNITAEEAVLGGIIIDPPAIHDVKHLEPSHFFKPGHSKIFQAMREMAEEQIPLDYITLTDKLKANNEQAAYLAGLTTVVPTASQVGHYGEIVWKLAKRRELIRASGEVATAAWNEKLAFDHVVEKAKNILTASVADHTLAYPHPNGHGIASIPSAKRSGLIPLIEFMQIEFPATEYLVEEILPKGHFGMVVGRPKVGKSRKTRHMAKCVDMGEEYLGFKTNRVPIALFMLEENLGELQEHIRQLNWDISNDVYIDNSIQQLVNPGGESGPGLARVAELAQRGFGLIVIDTYRKALGPYGKENDNDMQGYICGELNDIAHATNTTILLIHHQRKGLLLDDVFDSIRGASAIRASLDTVIAMDRIGEEKEGTIVVESRSFANHSFAVRMSEDGSQFSHIGEARVIHQIRAGRKTLESMLENDPDDEGMTAAQIAKVRGVSEQSIYRQLNKLAAEGYVYSKEDDSGKGRPLSIWHVLENYRG